MIEKQCFKCKQTKAVSEFGRDKHKPDGLNYWCKVCRRPINREIMAKRRAIDPQYGSSWWKANPEKAKEIQARFRKRHPDHSQKWRKANPLKAKANSNRRRARMALAGPRLEAEHIQQILTLQKWRCVGCRKSIREGYTLDHIVPLVAGGTNALTNIQMLCLKCNCSKNVRPQEVFMAQRGFLL